MTKVKYENIILMCFAKYGMKARDNQLELINDILCAYTVEKKKHVVLSAPTGTGKSIIAVIVAECMAVLEKLEKPSSYIMMHTNTLTEQYIDTFSKYGDKFATVMGAANYGCQVLKDTAENCVVKELKGAKRLLCDSCEYLENRTKMHKSDHFISNYSYYFVSAMNNPEFPTRHLAVFDEAHLINDVFSSHMAINISMQHNKYLMSRLQKTQTTNYVHYVNVLTKISEAIKADKVTMSNYGSFLLKMKELYYEIHMDYIKTAQHYFDSNNLPAFTSYKKISKLFYNQYSKILELENQKYEHVVDIQPTSLTVSPVFISKMFDKINKAKYHLFMSATLDDSFVAKTLKIPKSTIKYIKSPPVFPAENKVVVFVNHDNYNYSKLQDKKNLVEISNVVHEILNENSTKNGIILTPSFYINEFLSRMIRIKTKINLIEHEQGSKLIDYLTLHKQTMDNSVLISPSLFEGIDLPNDYSRFQIFVKAPYPSLSNKRIKYIFEKYPDIYETMTLYKVIQGFGRSTRSNTDYSITYALDRNIARLFFNSKNKWKDEFKVIKY